MNVLAAQILNTIVAAEERNPRLLLQWGGVLAVGGRRLAAYCMLHPRGIRTGVTIATWPHAPGDLYGPPCTP